MERLLLVTVVFVCVNVALGGRTPWGCEYRDKWYRRGQLFKPSNCLYCRCDTGNKVVCTKTLCLPPPCLDYVKPEGHCCAYCPHGPNCKLLDGRVLDDGEEVQEGDATCKCNAKAPRGPSVVCRAKRGNFELDNFPFL